jgi:hypothetical protein
MLQILGCRLHAEALCMESPYIPGFYRSRSRVVTIHERGHGDREHSHELVCVAAKYPTWPIWPDRISAGHMKGEHVLKG